MNGKIVAITLGITFFVIALMYMLTKVDNEDALYTDDTLEVFAVCITNSGAKFYGAFWCNHCQAQKKDFGKSANSIPYVECSTPNNTQVPECTEAGITGYPTWKFPDGSELVGRQSFAMLAEKTGCIAPVQ